MNSSEKLIRECHPLLERPILVFGTRFTPGWGRESDAPPPRQDERGRDLWGTHTPCSRFLRRRWDSDACCVAYLVRDLSGIPDDFPLLKVDGLSHLKSLSGTARVEWLCVDVDTPRHAPATEAWLLEQREVVRAFLPGAFYGTRSGYRVFWPLAEEGLELSEFKRFFAYMSGGLKKGSGKKQVPIGTLDGEPCRGVLRRAGIPADNACQSFNWRYFAPACRKLSGKKWVDVAPLVCDFSDVREIDPETTRGDWSRVETDREDERDRTPMDLGAVRIADKRSLASFLWADARVRLAEACRELRAMAEGRNLFLRNAVADLARTVDAVEALNPGVRDAALGRVRADLFRALEDGAREQGIERDVRKDEAAFSSGERHAASDPWGALWLDAQVLRYEVIVLRKGS